MWTSETTLTFCQVTANLLAFIASSTTWTCLLTELVRTGTSTGSIIATYLAARGANSTAIVKEAEQALSASHPQFKDLRPGKERIFDPSCCPCTHQQQVRYGEQR